MIYLQMYCKEVPITKLCNIERVEAGKIYKAGTCYIKLSAVDEFVGQIKEAGVIDNRYAVMEPITEMNTDYMYIAITRSFPEFLRRYRTTINLQFQALKNFTVIWHEDEKEQKYVVETMKKIQKEIDLVEKQIEDEKELKRWYLRKMMT